MALSVGLSALAVTAGQLAPAAAAAQAKWENLLAPKPSSAVALIGKTAVPTGIYVLNYPSNGKPVSGSYMGSAAYHYDVTGVAIFVPIAQVINAPITRWGHFDWDWSSVNTLVQQVVAERKSYSVALEVGYSAPGTPSELPPNFSAACGQDCAPLFHVWKTGGSGPGCLDTYVPLPWVHNVQVFWRAALTSLANDLRAEGDYGSLTLVHIPGVSVYDEEIRLPSGVPKPKDPSSCPGSTGEALAAQWDQLGYSDQHLESGFDTIVGDTARDFPDKYLGLSLFPPEGSSAALAFPDGNAMTATLVKDAARIAHGRLELQSDDLDPTSATITPAVISDAALYGTLVGWQSNHRGGDGGAACGARGTSCGPDSPDGPYFDLLANGAHNRGQYLEVWPADVETYAEAFAAAVRDGLYPPAPQYPPVPPSPPSTVRPPPCPDPPCLTKPLTSAG